MTARFIDSHCHLDFSEFGGREAEFLVKMSDAGVERALVAGVTMERFPAVKALVEQHDCLWGAVGVHPDTVDGREASIDELLREAQHPKIVAIGETGLDYYRLEGDLEWQRERFRTHIHAARQCGKPLIIHTRESASDTLAILREEGVGSVRGVFHCFTETWDVAAKALDLGFYISISGIVTFKKAAQVHEVAKAVPLDRLLIETDAPYLAPVPFRGKLNHPALVSYVGAEVARLRGISVEELGWATSANFDSLFGIPANA